jgi:hypothetical protein
LPPPPLDELEELEELLDELLELLDELDELLPPGHVGPPGSQPVPQLTVWQW